MHRMRWRREANGWPERCSIAGMQRAEPRREHLMTILRSGLAGAAATGADLATLSLLVAVGHWDPRSANVPALIVGGVVNFVGNREFAFHAREGNVAKQALGYSAVEGAALALNGVLFDAAMRWMPQGPELFWLVRLVTTNIVFLAWSYPLWRRVFRVRRTQCPG
jgi:putative flippase GtrA